MTDTPFHIKQLQLKIWLDKTPAQRLKQFLVDNEVLHNLWSRTKMSGIDNIEEDDFSFATNSPVEDE